MVEIQEGCIENSGISEINSPSKVDDPRLGNRIRYLWDNQWQHLSFVLISTALQIDQETVEDKVNK